MSAPLEEPGDVPATGGHASNSQHIPCPTVPTTAVHNSSSEHDSMTTPSSREVRVCAKLGNEDFYFNKSQLPNPPPPIHFSQDISGLFREWHSSQRLKISGRGIPIKYWEALYKKRKGLTDSGAWKLIGVEWLNWKVCAFTCSGSVSLTRYTRPVSGRGTRTLPVGGSILG